MEKEIKPSECKDGQVRLMWVDHREKGGLWQRRKQQGNTGVSKGQAFTGDH